MDIRKIAAGAGVAAIALGAVLPAAAHNVKTDDTVTGSVSGMINIGAKTEMEGSATISGTGEREGNENEINVATGDVNGDGRAEVEDSNESLTVTRADIDSDAVDSTSWNKSREATEVKSHADLKSYVASQMKNDENLTAVESNSSNVAVTYKQRGRFLGFIPVSLKATALVDQNGQVTLKYPWYAFLTATDRADLQAKLQASVDVMTSASATTTGTAGNSTTTPNANAVANANANASFKLTSDMQARIVSELRRIMGEELNASMNANASATATNK